MNEFEISGIVPRLRSAEILSERADAIVDDVLRSTARRNERAVARGRLAICGAFLLREFVLYGHQLLAGSLRDVVSVVALAGAIAISVLHLKRPDLRFGPVSQRLLSVFLDVGVFAAIVLATVLAPEEHYAGILRQQVVNSGVFVIAGAGLRLNRRFVVVATSGVVGVIVVACIVDVVTQPALATWGSGLIVYYSIFYLGFGVVADIFAGRSRSMALDAAREAFSAERARERFGAYVGREVAALALTAREIVLGGRRQPVAVLFCDLRGFTSASERQPPEEVVRQLNEYFEVMVAVIHAHGGVVDKYVGDAIMAVFGAPAGRPDDARRAVRAALAMEHALRMHNARRHMDGLPSLRIGVGVHYGDVVAGNIGTTRHAQYTVIGDVVNLASRLESATRNHGVSVLVSREAKDAADAASDGNGLQTPLPLRPLGTITVKGRERGVEIFAPESGAEVSSSSSMVDGEVSNPSNPLLSTLRRE